jgi:hypothetical protein
VLTHCGHVLFYRKTQIIYIKIVFSLSRGQNTRTSRAYRLSLKSCDIGETDFVPKRTGLLDIVEHKKPRISTFLTDAHSDNRGLLK